MATSAKAGTTANDSDESDESTVKTDDEEFSDFISSQWKNGVEVGLVIDYPLPFTNYLPTAGPSSNTTSESNADGEKETTPLVGKSIAVGGENDENYDGKETPQTLPQLTLSTVLQEGSIAPLFDGTQWAGTRVWKAAILGLEYLVRERQKKSNKTGFGSLLELGCGLGVPGMVWKQILSAEAQNQQQQNNDPSRSGLPRVVLTDRDSLVPQLKANINSNFGDDPSIEATALDWSREGISSLLRAEKETQGRTITKTTETAAPTFDICLNCDCVYEPLYGREAWESLADVLSEVAVVSPSTLLVTALERRNGDNVEGFLEKLEASGTVRIPIQRVVRHEEDPHHVIEIYVTQGEVVFSQV